MSKEKIREQMRELTAELKVMESADDSNEMRRICQHLDTVIKQVKIINERHEYKAEKKRRAEEAEEAVKRARKAAAAKERKLREEAEAERELSAVAKPKKGEVRIEDGVQGEEAQAEPGPG